MPIWSGLRSATRPAPTLGKVTAVQNFGGGDILEITFHGRKGVLIPFTQAAVPEVDIAGGFIPVDTSPPVLPTMPTKTDRRARRLRSKARPRGPRTPEATARCLKLRLMCIDTHHAQP